MSNCFSEIQLAFKNNDFRKATKVCQNQAQTGDMQAVYMLGVMSERGDGIEQDYTKAANFYKLASRSVPDALNALGILTEKGLGVNKDLLTAVKLYQEAAFKGVPEANYNLASVLFNLLEVDNVKNDFGAVITLLSDSKENLSDVSLNTVDDQKNFLWRQAMQFLRAAAEQNLVKAQYALGYFTEQQGIKDHKVYEDAKYWYTRAAENFNGEAAFRLAGLYVNGLGGRLNLKEAAFWYYEAYRLGIGRGAFKLAEIWAERELSLEEVEYLREIGLDLKQKDPKESAIAWYIEAAKAGDLTAASRLVNIYEKKWRSSSERSMLFKAHRMKNLVLHCGDSSYDISTLPQLPTLNKEEEELLQSERLECW